jgi:hypothetical protein
MRISNYFIKNFYYLLILIICFIYFCYFIKSLNTDYINHYAYQELFLNYEGGFVRRGLIGSIFYELNILTKISPEIFFPSLMIIGHSSVIICFFYILSRYKKYNLPIIIIIFSPALLLFPIYDFSMFFIKDVFVKFTILLHGVLIIKYSSNKLLYEKYLKYLVLPIISFVTIFIHEYQLFFFSIHFLLSIIILENKNIYKIYLYYFIACLVILFFFVGNEFVAEDINESLSKFNVSIHPQLAGGFRSHFGGWYKWHFFYFNYKDFFMLFMSFILSTYIFYLIFHNFFERKILYSNFKNNYVYLVFFIPCIGIFFAIDHGRNLSLLSTHLVTFYLVSNLNYKELDNYYKILQKDFIKFNLFIIFLFFYIFMWILPQDAGFGGAQQINTIFKGSLFSEIREFIIFLYAFISEEIIQLPEIKL